MNAVDRLRRDHQILRTKLSILENALGMGPDAWFVLRELSFTFSRQLVGHIRREEDLVAACRRALDPKVLAELAVEHRDEPAHLRALNQLFLTAQGQSVDQVRPQLMLVISGLRHHMAEEERDLFSILERTLAQDPAGPRPAPAGRTLDDTMTVNRVIQEHPATEPVFTQLFVNVPHEGCTCLDEVAWRHGMDSGELISRLEQAIRLGACGRPGCAANHRHSDRTAITTYTGD